MLARPMKPHAPPRPRTLLTPPRPAGIRHGRASALVCSLVVALLLSRPSRADDTPAPTSTTPDPSQPVLAPPVPPPTVAPQRADSGLGAQKTAALVGLGVGVVGFGVSMGYGIATIAKKNDAQQVCPTLGMCPTQDGVNRWNDADNAGTISTLAFVIGCAGFLEAAVLWFMPGARDGATTQVGLGPGSVRVSGSW